MIWAQRHGLRQLVAARCARRLRDRRRPAHPRLRRGPRGPDRRLPGAARDPARQGLRLDRQLPGRHQRHRHPGVRGRHPRPADRSSTPGDPQAPAPTVQPVKPPIMFGISGESGPPTGRSADAASRAALAATDSGVISRSVKPSFTANATRATCPPPTA